MRADNKVQITIEFNSKGEAILKNARGDIARLGVSSGKTGKAMGGLSKTSGVLQRGVGGVTSSIFSLQGALAGLGLGLLARSFIKAAETAEKYRVRLNVLLGSQAEGNRLFQEMAEYAGRVPFEYQEVMGAATQLSGVMKGGVDEIKKWMPLIGDLAAVSGLSIEETTGQVIRMYSAGAASADMFRERGILAMLGFEAGVSYSAEETRRKMMESWTKADSQFKGATGELAKTWEGQMSMMSDAWFQFRTDVMEAGVFEFMKGGLKEVLAEIDRLKKDGTMDVWAQDMAQAVIEAMADSVRAVGYLRAAYYGVKEAIVEVELFIVSMAKSTFDLFTFFHRQIGGLSYEAMVYVGLIDDSRQKLDLLAQVVADDLVAAQADYAQAVADTVNKTDALAARLRKVGQEALKTAAYKKETEDWAKAMAALSGEVEGAGKEVAKTAKLTAKEISKLKKAREKALKEAEKKHKAFLAAVEREHAKTLEGMKQAEDKYWEEVGEAYTDYLDNSKRITEEVYRHRAFKISGQADLLRAAGVDEADIQAHLKEKYVELEQQKLRASDSFFAGVRSGWLGLEQSQMTWAEHGEKVFNTFISASKNAWSDSFFNILKGDFQDLEDVWSDFLDSMLRSFVDVLAQMVTKWTIMQGLTFANNTFGTGFAIPGMPGPGPGSGPVGTALQAGQTYQTASQVGSLITGTAVQQGIAAGATEMGAGLGAVAELGSQLGSAAVVEVGPTSAQLGLEAAGSNAAVLGTVGTAAGIAAAVYVGGTVLESILSPYMGFGGGRAPTQAEINNMVALASIGGQMV